ncbi:MAG: sulfatase [Chloroflexi bacterium]|nr:sulfatase [Chloroflexota bacterium]
MPPNLLFVFCDELRRDATGYSGNPDVHTPAIDKLAAEGVQFRQAVANTPVCTPSRGCLLTGCWPQRHGAISNDLPIDPASPSIARALNGAGYRCGYIGKWHLGGIPRSRFVPPGPERLGFDAFWASWNCHHQYLRPRYFLDTPDPIQPEGYEPAIQTDLALTFLQDHHEHHQEQPFCLFLSWGPPHGPYRPLPPGYEDRYDPATLHLRPNAVDTPQERTDLAGYYAHMTAMDDQFARLMTALDQHGLRDDTLVVFASDHGSMLGSHGYHNKQFPYEESCGVPLVMRWPPRLSPGSVSDLLIGIVDYAPTLLGLLDVPVPPAMQGRDLTASITGGAPGPDSQYLQELVCCDQARQVHMLPWRAVRTRHATYVRNTAGPWLLFDNTRDPYQEHNLIGEESARGLQVRLEATLQGYTQALDDPLESAEAVLTRYDKTEAWAEREVFLHTGRNMAGDAPSVPLAAPKGG